MAAIKRFEDLEIWQKARIFCRNIFRITSYEKFAKYFRLKDQIKASYGPIIENITEWFERTGNKELVPFLYIAKGSCGESRSQLYRALDFEYIAKDEFEALLQEATELSKNISNFIAYLKQSDLKGAKYVQSTSQSKN